MLDLKAACRHLRQDPVLAKVIESVGPLEFTPRRLPPFQSVAQSIIHQQLSGRIAGIILERFTALFPGTRFPRPEQVLALDEPTLRSAGLSRAKAAALRDLSEKAVSGSLPSLKECDRLSEEDLIERFTEVRGVGRWTVEMLLIFNLGRPDVLPVHDLGVRRGYQLAAGKRQLPTPIQLARAGRCWAPHRTAAALYLWRRVALPN